MLLWSVCVFFGILDDEDFVTKCSPKDWPPISIEEVDFLSLLSKIFAPSFFSSLLAWTVLFYGVVEVWFVTLITRWLGMSASVRIGV